MKWQGCRGSRNIKDRRRTPLPTAHPRSASAGFAPDNDNGDIAACDAFGTDNL